SYPCPIPIRAIPYCDVLRDLPSFPTRRSSDLATLIIIEPKGSRNSSKFQNPDGSPKVEAIADFTVFSTKAELENGKPGVVMEDRSEEHTSELQSRFDLVCRLLLEKKKTRQWQT